MNLNSNQAPFSPPGDDLDKAGIQRWFQEEVAYHNAFEGGRSDEYPFFYHYYNVIFGLSDLTRPGHRVLDFGCAEGLTLSRISNSVEYHGIDVSSSLLDYARTRNPKAEFKLMAEDQIIPYPDKCFDVILCFGVLHHIPNVSFVLKEFSRVLKPGGKVLIREPITDMLKINGQRSELSPNERGLHPLYFSGLEPKLGLRLLRADLCFFGPLNQLRQRVLGSNFLVRLVVQLDRIVSSFFTPSKTRYSRKTFWSKFAPNAGYFLLERR